MFAHHPPYGVVGSRGQLSKNVLCQELKEMSRFAQKSHVFQCTTPHEGVAEVWDNFTKTFCQELNEVSRSHVADPLPLMG